MEFIDTHCHLNDPVYDADREKVIARAKAVGVTIMLQADIDSSERDSMLALTRSHPGTLRPMLGLYPGSVGPGWKDELDKIYALAASASNPGRSTFPESILNPGRTTDTESTADPGRTLATGDIANPRKDPAAESIANPETTAYTENIGNPSATSFPEKAANTGRAPATESTADPAGTPVTRNTPSPAPEFVAIGEIGLDYHYGTEFREQQMEAFKAQLELAAKMNLPVNIHLREATDDFFKVIESCRGLALRGNLHAFSGSWEVFSRLSRHGDWYVGIGGVLTFRKASIAEEIKRFPMDRIMLETDAPYLTPTPHRGERNESAMIPLIAAHMAAIRGITTEEVAASTTLNAKTLFNLR